MNTVLIVGCRGVFGSYLARHTASVEGTAVRDALAVELSTHTGRALEVRFGGVSHVLATSPEGMTVRALTEVASLREARVFVFANMDPSDPRSLKVAAERAEWRRDEGQWREC